jgi:hypothetical protein
MRPRNRLGPARVRSWLGPPHHSEQEIRRPSLAYRAPAEYAVPPRALPVCLSQPEPRLARDRPTSLPRSEHRPFPIVNPAPSHLRDPVGQQLQPAFRARRELESDAWLVELLGDRLDRAQEFLRELRALPRVLVRPRIGATTLSPRHLCASPWAREGHGKASAGGLITRRTRAVHSDIRVEGPSAIGPTGSAGAAARSATPAASVSTTAPLASSSRCRPCWTRRCSELLYGVQTLLVPSS